MSPDLIDAFERTRLLGTLPRAALAPLAEAAVPRWFASGETIFEVDAEQATLFVIRTGVVDLRTSVEGERLATLRAGQAIGELAVFDGAPRATAAVARTDCELVEVSRDTVVEVLEGEPGALLATVGSLARSLHQATEEVAVLNRFLDEQVRSRSEAVRQSQLEIVHRLGKAAEFRDDDIGADVYRMSKYCTILAEGAGIDRRTVEHLLVAAPLHDIGKIGVPDSVLLKAGKLNESEWRIMQAHTTMGAQILRGSAAPSVQLAERIALQHHEKWDGTGYPKGLSGEEISLEARICTIADVFDALTSRRPYKEPWPVDDALGLVDNSRGTMFDPELVAVFLHEEHKIRAVHSASVAAADAAAAELGALTAR